MNEVAQLAEMIKKDVKEEITELSGDLKEMARAVTVVSNSINTLITQNRLAEERHQLQLKENKRVYKLLDEQKIEIDKIKSVQLKEGVLNVQLRSRIAYIGGVVISGVTGGCLMGVWFVIKSMAKAAT